MKFPHRASLVAAVALSFGLVAGCGGGGGGDPVVDPGTGGGGTPGAGLNPGLTGSFWLRPTDTPSYRRINANTGVESTVITRDAANQSITFSPDGTRYAVSWHDTETGVENSDYMSVEVRDTATKAVVSEFLLEGYTTAFRFSKDNRYLAMVQYPDLAANNTLSRSGLLIVDLATPADPKLAVDFSNTGTAVVYDFDWLSADAYVYTRGDRKVITGSASANGRNERELGTLAVPAGFSLRRSLAASPDGQQLAIQLGWDDGGITKFDIWIASLDGTRVERFSNGDFGENAGWSPDGKYLVLRTNAGAVSIPGIGTGYCKRWYAAATERNVDEDSAGSRPVQYVSGGAAKPLECFSTVSYLQ